MVALTRFIHGVSLSQISLFITLSLMGTGVSAQMNALTNTEIAKPVNTVIPSQTQCTISAWKKMHAMTDVRSPQLNGMFIVTNKSKYAMAKRNYFMFSPMTNDTVNEVLTMAVSSAQMIKVPTYSSMSKEFVNSQIAKLAHDIPIQAARSNRVLDNELEIVVEEQTPMLVQVASTDDYVGCTNQKGCEAHELVIK